METVATIAFLCATNAGFYYCGWKAHAKRVRNPYRWQCGQDGCSFSVSGTDPVMVAQFSERHETRGHDNYPFSND